MWFLTRVSSERWKSFRENFVFFAKHIFAENFAFFEFCLLAKILRKTWKFHKKIFWGKKWKSLEKNTEVKIIDYDIIKLLMLSSQSREVHKLICTINRCSYGFRGILFFAKFCFHELRTKTIFAKFREKVFKIRTKILTFVRTFSR